MLRAPHLFAILCAGGMVLASASAQVPNPEVSAQEASLYDLALPADAEAAAQLATSIEAALNAKDRSLEHKLRDDQREVRSILAAARPKTGDVVLDVGSGGGYLGIILSSLVGDTGHVDIHNTPGWIAQFPGMAPEIQSKQIKRANIGYKTTRWDVIPGDDETYDLIVLGQVYHDAILEAANVDAMNQRFFAMLKPGGRLVIEDHAGSSQMPLGQQVGLHRIALDAVMDQVTHAGFRHTGSLAIISTYDNAQRNVFTPGIRGRTERFILTFEKPAD